MGNVVRHLVLWFFAAQLASSVACTSANLILAQDAGAGGRDGGGFAGQDGGHDSGGHDSGDSRASLPEAVVLCNAPTKIGCVSNQTASCDPICQTGSCDWCSQKCSYAGAGLTPQQICSSKGDKNPLDRCSISNAGTLAQSDNCAPGSICLEPSAGDNYGACFTLCGVEQGCASGVNCGQRKLSSLAGSVRVCDPPYATCGADGTCCNPLLISGNGCPADRTACLLVGPDPASGHSRTVCEFDNGGGRNGSYCDSARDCFAKNVCVMNQCRQICNNSNPCPRNGICTPHGSEYGFCPN